MRDRLKVIMLSKRQIDGRGYPIIRKPFLQEDLTPEAGRIMRRAMTL